MTQEGLSQEQMAMNGETLIHISNVSRYLTVVIQNIMDRMNEHDISKLSAEERDIFVEYTPKLAGVVYGSEEYKQFLEEMKPALDNHYANNSHHPEHFENGISDMSLLDIIEMLIDWKASSLRTKDGNIMRSLEIQKERFKIDDQLYQIMVNTAKELGFDESVNKESTN